MGQSLRELRTLMSLRDLPDADQVVVRQCLIAVATGNFIDDREMQTRMGVHRDKLLSILQRWPDIDDALENSDDAIAINNCLNEICHGIEIPAAEWSTWFNTPRGDIQRVFEKWRPGHGCKAGWIS
jgi:adenosyl cobinamide kinase/adenosyl cobinamide phosphate guanylyltransferase